VWSYLVLLIFTCFLLSIHAATAVGLVIILVPYILLNVKGKFTHSLGITLALGIPFLGFPWIFHMLLPPATALLTPQPLLAHVDLPRIINTYGYLPVLFCLLGTFLLVIRGGKKNYGLVLGLLALVVMLTTFFTFHYGVTIMYYRGLMYTMLMMSVVAGAGLMGVKELRLPVKVAAWLKAPLITKNAGNILCLVFIGLSLAMCIPSHLNEPYYHMIDEQDYEAFVWIRENVDNGYEKAILDPWKGTAFAAIAERYVYAKILAYPQSRDREAYEFLQGGCSDTDYLKENGISIIYTRWECSNPDLVEVRKNIYLLKETGESK